MSKICGIAGIHLDRSTLESLTKKMSYSMKHEQWHRVDEWNGMNAGFGHLSIGAVNEEAQPLFNRSRNKAIIFAGKIFGYEQRKAELQGEGCHFEFQNNDAEFVLNLYERYGADKFNELNGIFAFSIWDAFKKELILVNDRYGMRPVYYYHDPRRNIFAFASELKAISSLPLYEKKVNWEAWNVFLRLGFFIDDDTFFKDIHFLPPACVLRYDLKGVTTDRYWDCTNIATRDDFDEEADASRLVELFKQAVSRRIIPGRKNAVLLSGGIDSTGIAAELKSQRAEFTSYTTRKFYKVDEDQKSAEHIARTLGIKNNFCDLPDDFLEVYEPRKNRLLDYQCTEHAWLLPLLETIPSDTKINFDGLGFDFMCDTCMYDVTLEKYRNLIDHHRYEDFITSWYYSPKGYHSIKWPIEKGRSEFAFLSANIRKKFSTEHFIEKVKQLFIRVEKTNAPYIYFHLLTRARRCVATSVYGMVVNRLESFCPYLDNDFFDFLMSLPLKARLNRTLRTKILRRAYPELFQPDSCLITSNSANFVRRHENFYPQRVRNLSKIGMDFIRKFRGDVYDPFYMLPRIAKDVVMSKMFLLANGDRQRTRYYNSLHWGLTPQLHMLNSWLLDENIGKVSHD